MYSQNISVLLDSFFLQEGHMASDSSLFGASDLTAVSPSAAPAEGEASLGREELEVV